MRFPGFSGKQRLPNPIFMKKHMHATGVPNITRDARHQTLRSVTRAERIFHDGCCNAKLPKLHNTYLPWQ